MSIATCRHPRRPSRGACASGRGRSLDVWPGASQAMPAWCRRRTRRRPDRSGPRWIAYCHPAVSVGDSFVERMGSFYSDSLHPWGEGPVDVVAKHVHELLPGTVLDLGAGDGRNAVFLAERGFRVIAVDVVEAALG